ncbi:uncharacterized protein V6R79_024114 [Siganus canaliculatus]
MMDGNTQHIRRRPQRLCVSACTRVITRVTDAANDMSAFGAISLWRLKTNRPKRFHDKKLKHNDDDRELRLVQNIVTLLQKLHSAVYLPALLLTS